MSQPSTDAGIAVRPDEATASRFPDGVPVQSPTNAVPSATSSGATDASELKGAELDAALSDAGLSKSGSADDKRQRLAEHLANQKEN